MTVMELAHQHTVADLDDGQRAAALTALDLAEEEWAAHHAYLREAEEDDGLTASERWEMDQSAMFALDAADELRAEEGQIIGRDHWDGYED